VCHECFASVRREVVEKLGCRDEDLCTTAGTPQQPLIPALTFLDTSPNPSPTPPFGLGLGLGRARARARALLLH